jgi:hypothetical protein
MFCMNCGKELPPDAQFYSKCGKPIGGAESQEATRWETCEIIYTLEHSRVKLWARAVGANGEYNAGESPTWSSMGAPVRTSQIDRTAHKDLVDKLVRDGWQHVGTVGEWYNDRFRRPVAQDSVLDLSQWETCEINFIQKGGALWNPIASVPVLIFWAKARGPKGEFSAGEVKSGSMFTKSDFPREGSVERGLLEILSKKLLEEGWEPAGKGEHWFSIKYKRFIKN